MEKAAAEAAMSISLPQPFLQWGSRKRLRCGKVQVKPEADTEKKFAIPVDRRLMKAEIFNAAEKKAMANNNNHNFHSSPPRERSTRFHPVSNGVCTRSNNTDETHKVSTDAEAMQEKASNSETFVWPKFNLTLSRAEKEEDFMAMKGSKLPLRPKKRSKIVQKAINAVSPGGWLSDIFQERYEVREKKCAKKRPRGLKGMRSSDSDSE